MVRIDAGFDITTMTDIQARQQFTIGHDIDKTMCTNALTVYMKIAISG
jgi:hypothetical protein